MTARDQLQAQAKRMERIAAYLYDRAVHIAPPQHYALTAHTVADACQESADTLRGIAQAYAGRIP